MKCGVSIVAATPELVERVDIHHMCVGVKCPCGYTLFVTEINEYHPWTRRECTNCGNIFVVAVAMTATVRGVTKDGRRIGT